MVTPSLESRRVVGTVLEVDEDVFQNPRIYIRHCYSRLLNDLLSSISRMVLERASPARLFVVTGTPGIGKIGLDSRLGHTLPNLRIGSESTVRADTPRI